MLAVQGLSAGAGPASLLIVLAACVCVVYWRTMLRIAAVVVVALTLYGAVLAIDGLHHLAS